MVHFPYGKVTNSNQDVRLPCKEIHVVGRWNIDSEHKRNLLLRQCFAEPTDLLQSLAVVYDSAHTRSVPHFRCCPATLIIDALPDPRTDISRLWYPASANAFC